MLLDQLSNKSQEKDATKIEQKKSESSPVKSAKTQVVKEIENVKPPEEKSKAVPKLAQKEMQPAKLKQPLKTSAVLQKRNNNVTIKKMSNSVLLKHFPNLSKKTVIPLNEPDSSDDESDANDNPAINVQDDKPKGELFQSNLESFLKGMRQLKENKTSLANATPEKQKRLSMQLKAMYNKKEKEKTDISNLPLSKQIEYIQLKQLIARKESKLKKQAIVAKANDDQLNKVKQQRAALIGKATQKSVIASQITAVKAVQPNVSVSVKSIPKQANITNSKPVKVSQEKTIIKPVQKFKIIKKDSTKITPNAEIKPKQVKEAEVMIVEDNKTDDANDEEDEDILREMLLKEMQNKSKLTINLSGDERMVRVKKYNLTPHFRKKPLVENESKVKPGEKSDKEEKAVVNENEASKTKETKVATVTEAESKKDVNDESKLATSIDVDKTARSPRSAFQSRSAPSSPGKSRSPDGKTPDKSKTLSPSPLSRSSPNSPSRRADSPLQAKKNINILTNNPSTENTNELNKAIPSVETKDLSITVSEKSKDTSKKEDSLKKNESVVSNKILVTKQISVKKATTSNQNKIEPEKKGNVVPKKIVTKIPDPRVKKLKQPINAAGPATKVAAGPKPTTTAVDNNKMTKSAAAVAPKANSNTHTKKTEGTKAASGPKPTTAGGNAKITNSATAVAPKANSNTNIKKTEGMKPLATASTEMIAELKKEENNVIEKRSGLTTALFRMSAQVRHNFFLLLFFYC